jgi:Alr-MurF fusion protein
LKYKLCDIASILGSYSVVSDGTIENLLLDSRKIYSPGSSLFFAIKGPRRDGHQFIPELYKKGVRNFVVSEAITQSVYPEANFLIVRDTLQALQLLAASHRKQFAFPVIGITGSNGKTIVKEWLYQLLHEEYNIVRSPKSYNSQVGVPLSVWQMNEQNTLAIFEAGISQPGEMEKLEEIVRPTIGVLTNIGEAHSEGFTNKEQKLKEKLKLFIHCDTIIGKEQDLGLFRDAFDHEQKILTWGASADNYLVVKGIQKKEAITIIDFLCNSKRIHTEIPFTDNASIENAITCYCVLGYLGIDGDIIVKKMKELQPVNMRLELKKGINHCTIINDSYSADLSSLEIALNFLSQQAGHDRKTVILSDFVETGIGDAQLYSFIFSELKKYKITRLIGIGEKITKELAKEKNTTGIVAEFFSSIADFIKQFRSSQFKEEIILVKGARIFGFEEIVALLEQKVHQTVLEINLNAIAHNLRVYQSQLNASTKIMAMVKAFAYGSGGAEIAGTLQYHKVDYLGVAYVDEGVELRKAGVTLPIMVLNPEEAAFESLVENNLEPDLYSFNILKSFSSYLDSVGIQQYPVHIELETGMNRLGFAADKMERLGEELTRNPSVKIQSVFSHLASSEDPEQDDFTLQQFDRFKKAVAELKTKLNYSFIEHIANSAAIFRLPQLQMHMVRLGIGLYGVDSSLINQSLLSPVASLKSTIAQVKNIKVGESVSYNRKGVVKRDSVIAIVRIGYADGFSRRLGNGIGKMLIKGKLAPVIGIVCMDMTMVDVTDINGVKEGDEVIVFGEELTVQHLAQWAGTIPYEIMTGISQRVKRVYFEE